jgi:hypothetical protein
VQRTLVLGAAWTASAAAAVGLGFLAVSLVGASASPGPQPVASTTTSPAASPAWTAALPSGQMDTVGGTVYASCADGVPSLASAPAPGWWVDDSSQQGAVEFRNGVQKVEVHAVCVDGGPQFSVEGPRADDSGGGPASTSSASNSPAAPSSGDDSSGRDGGGHGSDDPAGDDSSGRGGGGHGSDD